MELLEAVIGKLVDAWDVIKEKPVEFLKNLLGTVKLAFHGFFQRIGLHLKNGIVGWITSSFEGSKIYWPQSWTSPGELFSFAASVLGLSVDHVIERVALKYPDVAAGLRKAMGIFSEAWDWLSLIFKGDYKGLWDKIKGKLADIENMVMQGIMDFLMKRVIAGATVQLAAATTPTVVSQIAIVLIDTYKTIKTVVKYMKKILTMVNTMLDSILNIAAGTLQPAADLVEKAFDMGMPVVIGFLAELVNLGDVSEKIQEAIEKLRDKVDEAIDWLIEKVASAIKTVVGAVKGALEWWRERRNTKVGDEKHTIFWEGEGEDAELVIESPKRMRLDGFLDDLSNQPNCDSGVIDEIRKLLDQIAEQKKGGFGKGAGSEIAAMQGEIARKLEKACPSLNMVPQTHIVDEQESIHVVTRDGTDLGNSTVGKHVKAEPLSYKPPDNGWTGSQPGDGNQFWKQVNLRKDTYVQGHLLNHHLFGPGIDENLVPISRKMNSRMSAMVEQDLKRRVLEQYKVISYEITVEFGSWPGLPYKYIPAENQLPRGMELKAYEMNLKKTDESKVSPERGSQPSDWEKGNQIVYESVPNTRPDDTNYA